MSNTITNKELWYQSTDKFYQVYFLETAFNDKLKRYNGYEEYIQNICNLFPKYWMKPVDKKDISYYNFRMEFDKETLPTYRFGISLVYGLPNYYTVVKDIKTSKIYNPKSFSILFNEGEFRYPNRLINMTLVKELLENIPIIYNEDGSTTDEIKDNYISQYISVQNEVLKEALSDLFETIYMIPQIDGINNGKVSGVTNIQDIKICVGEKFDSTGRVKRIFISLDNILTLANIYNYYKSKNKENIDLLMYNIIYGYSASIYASQKINIPKYIVSNTNKVLEAIKLCSDLEFNQKSYIDKQIEILKLISK